MVVTGNKTGKGRIDAPIKIIFTDYGAEQFMRQNRTMNRYRLSDNLEEYGIQLEEYSPATVQRMLLLGYIGKLEMPLDDVVGKRKDIIDFSKLVAHAMLYRQFNTVAFDSLVQSELIQRWNRQNPKNTIDTKTKFKADLLQTLLKKNADAVKLVKQELLSHIHQKLERDRGATDEERRITLLLAERFLENLNPLVWFILTAYKDSDPYFRLMDQLKSLLGAYVGKASISEYLALMVIELLMSIHTADSISGPGEKEAGDEETESYILWKINRKRPLPNDRAKMHITITNQRMVTGAIKSEIHDRANTSVREKTLKDFYKDAGEGGAPNLGLYYLSYLNDACRKVGVLFESFVNSVPKSGQTLIHLVLTF